MSRRRSWFSIAFAVAALTALPAPSLGLLPACPVSGCSVTDGNAVLATDSLGQPHLLTVDGTDQLFLQAFYVTRGMNSPANPIALNLIASEYPLVSASQDEAANQIVLLFADATASFAVTYTLTGGDHQATVAYLVVITNLFGDDNSLAIVDYVDFDLNASSTNDRAEFIAPDTIRYFGEGIEATARSISAFDYFNVAFCCQSSVFAGLVDGHLAGNTGPLALGDAAGAFQNNITLSANGAFTISRELFVLLPDIDVIAPAPSLSALGLFASLAVLAGIARRGMRRRRV